MVAAYDGLMSAAVKRHQAAGYKFFSSPAMGLFASVVESTLYADRYFITSELFPGGRRLFTVREIHEDASITTVGEFGQFRTKRAAADEIRAMTGTEYGTVRYAHDAERTERW